MSHIDCDGIHWEKYGSNDLDNVCDDWYTNSATVGMVSSGSPERSEQLNKGVERTSTLEPMFWN
jgi:hypothetical protein